MQKTVPQAPLLLTDLRVCLATSPCVKEGCHGHLVYERKYAPLSQGDGRSQVLLFRHACNVCGDIRNIIGTPFPEIRVIDANGKTLYCLPPNY